MLPRQTALSKDATPIWLLLMPLGFLAVIAVLQIFMVLRFEVNWDEFFLLDWVYKWNAGELDLVLQTIYFRAFSWLPAVSDNEVSQIVVARAVMLACLSICCGFIYSLCRKFTTSSNAILSLLFFLTMSFVFRHAASFRADMLVVTLLMGILWCLMTPVLSWKRIVVCGALLGLAGMITVKAIFYVPIIATILLAHWGHSKWQFSVFLKSVSLGLLAILSFCALYMLHSFTIETTASSAKYLAHSASGSLLEEGLFPRLNIVTKAVKTNPVVFVLIAVGFVFCLTRPHDIEGRWSYLAAASFVFPLLTVVFYRHGFHYFYTFMLAPATILIAIALSMPIFKKGSIVIPAFLAVILLNVISVFPRSMAQNLNAQKQVLQTVHNLFPEPTSYIDRCAMVSSYPKSGLFMSSWVMTDYYKKNTPIMETILTEDQPKFILANIDGLDLDNITKNSYRRFLRSDEELLKSNYVHHWGPIYVAGKFVELAANKPQDFYVYIEGRYGIESADDLEINGKAYISGDIVELKQGRHNLFSENAQSVILRWEALEVPKAEASNSPLFHGF